MTQGGNSKKNSIPKVPRMSLMNLIKPSRELKFGRWFLGATFILIGLVYLLEKLDFFPFELGIRIWQLWPLVIVYVGLIFLGGKNKIFAIIVFAVIFVVTVYVGYMMFSPIFGKLPTGNTSFSIAKDKEAKIATFSFEANQIDMNIKGGAEKLLEGSATSSMKIGYSTQIKNSIQEVLFLASTEKDVFWGSVHENRFDLTLNSEISSLIHFDVSSMNLNLDLRELSVDYLDIDAGASTINLKLGTNQDRALFDLDVGAGVINIEVPEDLAIKLDVESGFSKKELDGFFKVDDNIYESYNYGKTDKVVEINLNLGVAHLQVEWE